MKDSYQKPLLFVCGLCVAWVATMAVKPAPIIQDSLHQDRLRIEYDTGFFAGMNATIQCVRTNTGRASIDLADVLELMHSNGYEAHLYWQPPKTSKTNADVIAIQKWSPK